MFNEKEDIQIIATEIANVIVTYCREINKVLNSTDFTEDDIPRVQEMFRGLNHAASSYERIYRILHDGAKWQTNLEIFFDGLASKRRAYRCHR